ncbi:hypothetical protein DM01DRAFT_264579 [Hesseltinella vesiculosa]|uniref:Uncharacterized protein n=1 Tax=Hesseltinella vesiculosa TaxID=101127 RepID=A0A1X2G5D6_9FUNG|nr:hypothetical protein DM01DRAFT_264579 [Hesseltinella vesiculosa]
MANPLDHCLERLHLKDDAMLRERSMYYQGQCQSKVPGSVFRKGPNSQPVISIQLAHESQGLFGFNHDLAAELAGCSVKMYESMVVAVRKHLGLASTVTFDTLGVAFGSVSLAQEAYDLWHVFTEQHISKLSPAAKSTARQQFQDQGKWKAAVFYACAKAHGVSVDSSQCLGLTQSYLAGNDRQDQATEFMLL